MSQTAQKSISIDNPIDHVKSAISDVLSLPAGRYVVSTKNDAFGIYQFSLMDGLQACIIDLAVGVEGERSKIDISVVPAGGSTITTARMTTHLNEFLNVLSKRLAGEEITAKSLKQMTSSGCMVIVAVIISALCIFSCSKSDKECWECKQIYKEYNNNYLTDSTWSTSTVCDVTDSDIRKVEQDGSDTINTQANGNFIRVETVKKCQMK